MRPLCGEHLFSLKCSASQLPVFVLDPERSYETLTFETLFPTGTRPQLYTMCCHCDVAVMLWCSHDFHGKITLLLVSHLQRSLESIWSGWDVCWRQGLQILMIVLHPLQSGCLPMQELALRRIVHLISISSHYLNVLFFSAYIEYPLLWIPNYYFLFFLQFFVVSRYHAIRDLGSCAFQWLCWRIYNPAEEKCV